MARQQLSTDSRSQIIKAIERAADLTVSAAENEPTAKRQRAERLENGCEHDPTAASSGSVPPALVCQRDGLNPDEGIEWEFVAEVDQSCFTSDGKVR